MELKIPQEITVPEGARIHTPPGKNWEDSIIQMPGRQLSPGIGAPFSGKHVLLLGTGGLGQALFEGFRGHAGKIVGVDAQESNLSEYNGDGLLGVRCDIRDESDIQEAVEEAGNFCDGRVDIIFQTVGKFVRGAEVPMTELSDLALINHIGPVRFVENCADLLRESHDPHVAWTGTRNVISKTAPWYTGTKKALEQEAARVATQSGWEDICMTFFHPDSFWDTPLWTLALIFASLSSKTGEQEFAEGYDLTDYLTVNRFKKAREMMSRYDVAEIALRVLALGRWATHNTVFIGGNKATTFA